VPENGEPLNIYFWKINKNENDFYSIFDVKFPNLSELVEYYRVNPIFIKENNMQIMLGVGIHRKTVSIHEDWYAPEFTRDVGDKLLEKYKLDGSFFIRSSTIDYEPNEEGLLQAYTLTFYMKNEVFYSRIFVKVEDNEIIYYINNKSFLSLRELVNYHKNFPVHNKQTLVKGIHSLSKELVLEESVYQEPIEPIQPRKPTSNNYTMSSISQSSSLIPFDSSISNSNETIDVSKINITCLIGLKYNKFEIFNEIF
jgi:hypothetical protein